MENPNQPYIATRLVLFEKTGGFEAYNSPYEVPDSHWKRAFNEMNYTIYKQCNINRNNYDVALEYVAGNILIPLLRGVYPVTHYEISPTLYDPMNFIPMKEVMCLTQNFSQVISFNFSTELVSDLRGYYVNDNMLRDLVYYAWDTTFTFIPQNNNGILVF